ncbi:MAG: tRNA dihydrouridine(20/20a) synthase DusA [Ancalomicrobiaceae bacterium]|nr:tRNA dihydrouridine(20/20a) synthase DusA [Ancalomicrobiaceae bacterium]
MADLPSYRFSTAPMIDWTDRHCRVFHRLLTRRALLYTEMVTAPAIRHGDRKRLLDFSPAEQPVALQIGGSDPAELAEAAKVGEDFGYVEINLNVGCPSDRVQSGRFGACLMAEPLLVATCVAAMKAAVTIPVTVKCRIGIDDQDPEAALPALVEAIVAAGVDRVIVHARKAWLQGLSPKENRTVPPLDYAIVRRLKAAYPMLPIVLNGGIAELASAERLLAADADGPVLDGVMLGRAAYETPALLADVDRRIFGEDGPNADLFDVLDRLEPYVAEHLAAGGRLPAVARHMLGLFAARPGARSWRRILTVEASRPGAGLDVLRQARAAVVAAADAQREWGAEAGAETAVAVTA